MKKIRKDDINYSNYVFFRYALSGEDEASKFIRHSIIEAMTGIHPRESIVLNPIINSNIQIKKGMILNLHIRDCEGNEYNIEMQTTFSGTSDIKRFNFYGSRMLSNQLGEEENYSNLKPIFQFIFINAYARYNQKIITEYEMRDIDNNLEGGVSLIRRFYIHLPAIDKIANEKGIQNMTAFEQLCFLFKNNDKNEIIN